MKVFDLLDKLEFNEKRASAEALLADDAHRILRFALKAGQEIKEHQAPSSSVILLVLQGSGLFSDGDNTTQKLSAQQMLIYPKAEKHSVKALEDLVFVAILREAPHN